jgi:hypothetical protein
MFLGDYAEGPYPSANLPLNMALNIGEAKHIAAKDT